MSCTNEKLFFFFFLNQKVWISFLSLKVWDFSRQSKDLKNVDVFSLAHQCSSASEHPNSFRISSCSSFVWSSLRFNLIDLTGRWLTAETSVTTRKKLKVAAMDLPFLFFCQTLEKKTLNLFNHSKGTEERAQLSDFGEGKNMETNGHWQSNMAAGSEQLETIFARKCPSLPSLGDVRWKEEKWKMLNPVHVAR